MKRESFAGTGAGVRLGVGVAVVLVAVAVLAAGRPSPVPLLFSARYLPHQFCYLAQPGLIWTNVATDSLIAISYAALFGCLLWIAWRLRAIADVREVLWILVSFGLFIMACGVTHVMEVITVWQPLYPLAAAFKVLCAIASVPTAIAFARATPVLARRIPQLVEVFAQRQAESALEEERRRKMESLAQMAAGIAHEIENPLAIIHGTASDLFASAGSARAIERTEVLYAGDLIRKTSERIVRILKGLRGFARDAASDPMEPASIRTILDDVVQLQGGRFARQGVALDLQPAPILPLLLCRETQIVQVLTNLLNNALDAIADGGGQPRWVGIELRENAGCLEIDVTDSGPGIHPELRQRVMEPFFTTRTRGLGMGVGLSLSRAIALEHGGDLVLCAEPGPTRFRLTLPLVRAETP